MIAPADRTARQAPIVRARRAGSGRPWVWLFLAAWAGLLGPAAGLYGQAVTLRGRVIGPAGAPVEGAVVALHRVAGGSGAEVGRAVAGPDGTFAVEFDPDAEEGLYFAATRHDGGLYMGPPFRTPEEAGVDYVIRVGVDPAGGAAGLGPAPAGPAPPGGGPAPWIIAAIVGLVAIAAVGAPLIHARGRPLATRALFLELAELEERRESSGAGPDGATEFDARRAAIHARLMNLTRAPASNAADHD